MIRHLFKTGNSTVLSLPKEVLDSLGIKNGELVNLELDRSKHQLIITRLEKPTIPPEIDQKFAQQVDEFIEQYRPALNELAK